jgi:hypothetical protein
MATVNTVTDAIASVNPLAVDDPEVHTMRQAVTSKLG